MDGADQSMLPSANEPRISHDEDMPGEDESGLSDDKEDTEVDVDLSGPTKRRANEMLDPSVDGSTDSKSKRGKKELKSLGVVKIEGDTINPGGRKTRAASNRSASTKPRGGGGGGGGGAAAKRKTVILLDAEAKVLYDVVVSDYCKKNGLDGKDITKLRTRLPGWTFAYYLEWLLNDLVVAQSEEMATALGKVIKDACIKFPQSIRDAIFGHTFYSNHLTERINHHIAFLAPFLIELIKKEFMPEMAAAATLATVPLGPPAPLGGAAAGSSRGGAGAAAAAAALAAKDAELASKEQELQSLKRELALANDRIAELKEAKKEMQAHHVSMMTLVMSSRNPAPGAGASGAV